MKISTRYLTQAAIIAAIYAVLTILIAPLSYGQTQIRFSEALTILPVLTPAAIPGLTVGCLIANIAGVSMGATTVMDIGFGTVASLVAAALTYLLRRKPFLAPLPPILVNGVIIGWMLNLAYQLPLLPSMGWVALGQILPCYLLGLLLHYMLRRLPSDMIAVTK